MNAKQFAKYLNGRERNSEIINAECDLAKELNLLIFFGYSDDNVEFRGIIHNEFSEGTLLHTYKGRVIEDEEFCSDKMILGKYGFDISSDMGVIGTYSDEGVWSFEVIGDIETHTFDIFDEGVLYCRGLVIDMSSHLKGWKYG
jgi:hypothetical protein